MNPQLKKAWLADLRAHPELKGCGALRSYAHTMKAVAPTKYCCLGRLLIVAGKEEYIDDLQTNLGMEDFTEEVADEFGLDEYHLAELIRINDDGNGSCTNDDGVIFPAPDYSEVIDYIDAKL